MSVLARADGVLGEVALRRRDDDVLQLWCNGTLVMESDDDASERRLADEALALAVDAGARDDDPGHAGRGTDGDLGHRAASRRGLAVLLGGLGLGSTAAHLLASADVARLVVVEVEPVLLAWARAGLLPGAATALADRRTEVVLGDVRTELHVRARERPGDLDAVLLDVDNGPDHLVHPANAHLYAAPALADAAACVRAGGVVVVWAAAWSDPLARALGAVVGAVRRVDVPVRPDCGTGGGTVGGADGAGEQAGREVAYVLHIARRERGRG